MTAQSSGKLPQTPAATAETPGGLLRQERERRALTIQQAAEDLHLDPWVIDAIESNRFLALGAPVYAKGHLRKYALLLGLSPELIIERYYALSDTPAVPMPVPTTTAIQPRRDTRPLRVPLAIAAVVVVAVAISWIVLQLIEALLPLQSAEIAIDRAAPAAAPVAAPESAVTGQSAPETAPVAADEPAAVQSAPASAASTSSAQPVRLRLAFTEPSWTEVYDASGKRLIYELGTVERVRTVVGVPPLRVTVGVAAAVAVEVNGRAIVIPRQAGREAAKFVIEADGVVR